MLADERVEEPEKEGKSGVGGEGFREGLDECTGAGEEGL